MADLAIEDLLVAISACWCTALQDSVGGAPATCCLIGQDPVVPDCCPGFAWTRLVSAYPAGDFPNQLNEALRCGHGLWGAVVEIGITRCAPEPCGALDNSCCDAEMDTTLTMLDDFARMRSVLACCTDIPRDAIVPGTFRTQGGGGCITSAMQATFRFSSGDCSC